MELRRKTLRIFLFPLNLQINQISSDIKGQSIKASWVIMEIQICKCSSSIENTILTIHTEILIIDNS